MTHAQYVQRSVLTADGTTLNVHEVDGDGQLVVALHGFTGSGSAMLALLEAIRGERPAIAVDLIGHGASDSPDHRDSYSMASVVDQVLSLVGTHDRQTVHLLGYSMGGRIALSMAARAPWYFASITTVSATTGIEDPSARQERYDADHELAAHIETVGVAAFVDEWLENPLFANYLESLDGEGLSRTTQLRTANSAVGLANSLRGTGTGSMPPVWDRLASLRSPLLAIAGALDERYVEIAKKMTDAAPFGQLGVIEGAGHVVHDEKLGGIAALVAGFLQSCESTTR